MAVACFQSPVGLLSITEENGEITRLDWGGQSVGQAPVLDRAVAQLSAYFAGDLDVFDLGCVFGGIVMVSMVTYWILSVVMCAVPSARENRKPRLY